MTEYIESKINEISNEILLNVTRVYNIFKEYFGEDFVDLQNVKTSEEIKSILMTTPIRHYYNSGGNRFNSAILSKKFSKLYDEELSDVLLTSCKVGLRVKFNYNHPFILVWFPKVRVTNEHDKYIDIEDLYAKVTLTYQGEIVGRFQLNRATYNSTQFNSSYLHSHVSSIPTGDFESFQNCCTGTGPINSTICNLAREFDADIWQLFCLELDKYVHVESLAGVPYHRLEEVGASGRSAGINSFIPFFGAGYISLFRPEGRVGFYRKFISHLIKSKILKFNYSNGSYSIGMSYLDFIFTISNSFIDWYNNEYNEQNYLIPLRELKSSGLLKEAVVANNKIYYDYYTINRLRDYDSYQGAKICTFKGNTITLRIIDAKKVGDTNTVLLLNEQTALFFLTIILKIVNYGYRREEGESNTSTYYL